jgi:hypothetical protein
LKYRVDLFQAATLVAVTTCRIPHLAAAFTRSHAMIAG